MPLRFLLDEDLRGPLWNAIIRHNIGAADSIDALRVGDSGAPPTGTLDDALLVWTETHDRILVSFDKSTMQGHLHNHLAAGRSSPGIFQVRAQASIPATLSFL